MQSDYVTCCAPSGQGLMLSQANLLIIDSSEENTKILYRLLSKDCAVITATTSQQALQSIDKGDHPDIILLAISAESGNGLDLLRLPNKKARTKEIPVILMANRYDVGIELQGLSLGAVDYNVKPFHIPAIKARINNHLTAKRRVDRLRYLADIDPLTLIPNRRRFEMSLQQEWKRACRTRLEIAILMIDLDDFKSYNDRYGHDKGDDFLRVVAGELSKQVRRTGDMVARYGGEEFVVLMQKCSLANALHIAELMRAAIERLSLQRFNLNSVELITASISCAVCIPTRDGAAKHLLVEADRNMYMAKSLGKNRAYCDKTDLVEARQDNAE
ncbi:MAG: diguanylate cyclase [Candidatus Thiodiazotropha sp.]